MLLQSNEQRAEELLQQAKHDVQERWNQYHQISIEHSNGHSKK
jgi:hypothetical protein